MRLGYMISDYSKAHPRERDHSFDPNFERSTSTTFLFGKSQSFLELAGQGKTLISISILLSNARCVFTSILSTKPSKSCECWPLDRLFHLVSFPHLRSLSWQRIKSKASSRYLSNLGYGIRPSSCDLHLLWYADSLSTSINYRISSRCR